MPSLYPYNLYILYLAIAAVVLCMIVLVTKVVSLLKALQPIADISTQISAKAEQAQIKTEVISGVITDAIKVIKPLTIILPLLLAIQKEYRNDEHLHGINGYRSAADQVFQKKAKKGQLNAVLQSIR